jgi:drug/metabolite transporter (DMT)-like permease
MASFLTHHRGITYFVTAMLCFSAMNVTIRANSTVLDPLQMVFLRNAASLLLILPFALRQGVRGLKTSRFPRHTARAMIGLLAMESWFFALLHLPVNTATALSFTAPLFSTLFAVAFLHERIGLLRITALIIGFMGVMVVANPFAETTNSLYMLIVLISAALMAVAGAIVKTLTLTEPSWRIVFYMSLLMSLLSLPFALPVWQTPDLMTLTHTLLIAAFATTAQFCLAQALASEKIIVLVPFEFTRLIFTALMASVVLHESLTPATAVGSVIIIASTVFIAWRENVKKRGLSAPDTVI